MRKCSLINLTSSAFLQLTAASSEFLRCDSPPSTRTFTCISRPEISLTPCGAFCSSSSPKEIEIGFPTFSDFWEVFLSSLGSIVAYTGPKEAPPQLSQAQAIELLESPKEKLS